MKTILFALLFSFSTTLLASVSPGDFASYKGTLDGKEYVLYRTEVLSYNAETSTVEYKLTTETVDGIHDETIKTEQALTDEQGAYLVSNCEQYGERIEFPFNGNIIAGCRVKDVSSNEFYIDVANVPFGCLYFHEKNGSFLTLVDFKHQSP
jgi:hypothetical protein